MSTLKAINLSACNQAVLESMLSRTDASDEMMRDFWRVMLVCFNTPRPSTNYDGVTKEERTFAIRAVLKQICVNQSLVYKEDGTGNMIISNFSCDAKAKFCFQGHMDVVVSKNEDVDHDFDTEGVDVQITPEGTIKPVKGITLGADNGVAIACGLAALITNKNVPLELLVTKNEETSFDGACGVDASLISAETLVNLDSEVENMICVGSAGGFEQHFTLPLELDTSPTSAYKIKIRELKGGHSGIDIHKEKQNAIFALCRILLVPDIRIAELRGGTSTNAIPRECYAVVATDAVDTIKQNFADLKKEIEMNEPSVVLEIESLPESVVPFTRKSSTALLSLLFSIGTGVVRTLMGEVESSFNLGMAFTDSNSAIFKYLVRSTSVSWMHAFARQMTLIGETAGAQVNNFSGFFGAWEPDFHSSIVEKLKAANPKNDVKLYTVHAGLECSTILERFVEIGRAGVECASIGPQIEHAHSPDECLFIESAVNFVRWVDTLVKQ